MVIPQVAGTGSWLPGPPITNDALVEVFGRGLRRLCSAIGVEQRHWAVDPDNGWRPSGIRNSEMAARAASDALRDAQLSVSDVDLLLLVTATPDYPFPATVTLVQELLGIDECVTIELRGACAGVTQALSIADLFIRAQKASVAVVIGSEICSCFADLPHAAVRQEALSDDALLNIVMFGDGAGAVVLSGHEVVDEREGLFATLTNSVGASLSPGFLCRIGGSLQPFAAPEQAGENGYVVHDHRAILKHGPALVIRAFMDLAAATALGFEDYSVIIPPQANPVLTAATLRAQGLDSGRVFWNVDRVGNTSSASLLIALDDANRSGRLVPGCTVALLGAEASKWLYGAAALTWTRPSH